MLPLDLKETLLGLVLLSTLPALLLAHGLAFNLLSLLMKYCFLIGQYLM